MNANQPVFKLNSTNEDDDCSDEEGGDEPDADDGEKTSRRNLATVLVETIMVQNRLPLSTSWKPFLLGSVQWHLCSSLASAVSQVSEFRQI